MKLLRLAVSLVICVVTFNCSSPESKLIIATSANMQYAMKALAESFEQETGVKADLIISSSGKLTSQILVGAPYDIFFSADLKYPEYLADENITLNEPEIYAYGQLVLWTTIVGKSINPHDLLLEDRIAIANPKIAPYGKAAWEVLEKLEIQEIVRDRLVFGESIAQVNQFITIQSADVGFTSKSSVIANPDFGGKWVQLTDSLYTPITQAMVILKDSKRQESAFQLAEFVKSAKGQEILNRFGYSTSTY